jgi:maleate cis-trans isomerase
MTELEYAKRGLVGVLTPQANTTVEPELKILWPAGITMLNARLISNKTHIEERLVDYTNQIEEALDQFANVPLDAVAFGCTGASYLIGQEKEIQICERIKKNKGFNLVTAARAVTDSFIALGAKKIGLVSPYSASLTEISVTYWQDAGFEVINVANVYNDASNFHPIYSLRAGSSTEALLSLQKKEIDAIVMLGTGMPTLQPVLDCKHWEGPPVTSCMLSLAWRTMLYIDGKEPNTENMLTWSNGEKWQDRMESNSF